MPDLRRVVAAVAALCLLTAPAGAAGLGGLAQESVDPDAVVMDVALQEDGDAEWTVTYRVRLADDNETAAFEDLRDDVRANESAYVDRFADRMGGTVAAAENATGREMAVENVSVDAETTALPQEYGVLTYRFRWTNFAAVAGDEIRAGDALGGLFLDGESRLRMSWPEGYERASATPSPDATGEREVAWQGPRDFDADEPRLVVAPGTAATPTEAVPDESGGSAWIVALSALLGLAGVAAVLWANRRYGWTDWTLAGGDGDDGPDDAASSGAEDADGGDAAAAPVSAGDDGPPPELLSNEERVLTLLEQHGGRMKQQQVAADLDWTAAKTSQVIGDLRDDDEVETFRIGRENVVTLPDVDVAGDAEDS
ncbi:helix-turn-helix transcriptional regulator [Halomicrobium salinisoli]|uniref:helix-turn-helix transcriptional regulator n=1 Tax=Halomicrobium salinisoli TaxID=2878391 RepID=UPI001CF0541C|nr:hypothetical protein [Halomicrobium salinisoli]